MDLIIIKTQNQKINLDLTKSAKNDREVPTCSQAIELGSRIGLGEEMDQVRGSPHAPAVHSPQPE